MSTLRRRPLPANRGVSVDVTPNSGEDIGAPPSHEAYAHAPDLRREMHQVLALGAEPDGCQARPVTGPLVDATAAERAWLLRRAALMDGRPLTPPAPSRSAPPQKPPDNSSRTIAAIPTWWPVRTTPTRSRSLPAAPLRPPGGTPPARLPCAPEPESTPTRQEEGHMTRKDRDTQYAPAAAGQLRSPRLPHPRAMREHRAGRRQERSRQGTPRNAPWPNTMTHRLFQAPERGCSQGQPLGLHPAQTPPHTPQAEQPAQVAVQVTGGELRLAVGVMPVKLPVVAATGDEFTCAAWLDDAVGISRWRGRRTPVKPPCQVHRETCSQAPAYQTAGSGTNVGLPGHLLRIPVCDDECRPSVGAEPCRVVDIDRVQQRGVPAECGRDTEGELFAVSADGQPYWTRPPAAVGRRPRPKVCASRRVNLPHGPVMGGTLLWAAAEVLRAPGERWGHARGGKTRCATGAPAPATAARNQAARIAETGTRADAFEGVV